jgi:choline monooxygenase
MKRDFFSLQDLAAVDAPIERAKGLPNDAYVSAEFAHFERESLLASSWMAIGTAAQVPQPGDMQPVEILGLPLVFLRDREGAVQVFHNVCSHRGFKLAQEAGNCGKLLRCPYHSWAYDLTGKLQATPLVGGPGKNACPGFDRSQHGLRPVRAAIWFDVIFVNIDGQAPEFEDFIAPMVARWEAFDPVLFHHGGADSRFEMEVGCNWKLAVENFCEAYHLPWIHPGLNSYSRLEDHYNIALEDFGAGQGSLVYRPQLSPDGKSFPKIAGLPEKWQQGAEYIAVFPNVLLGVHYDHLFVVVLIPETEKKTRDLFEIYYLAEAANTTDYAALRDANRRAWSVVFAEDLGVVEGMQAGRQSPAFQGGVFSPVMDGPTHCFHKWAARRYARSHNRERVAAE